MKVLNHLRGGSRNLTRGVLTAVSAAALRPWGVGAGGFFPPFLHEARKLKEYGVFIRPRKHTFPHAWHATFDCNAVTQPL